MIWKACFKKKLTEVVFFSSPRGYWTNEEQISTVQTRFWVCQSPPSPPLDKPPLCEVFTSFLFMFFSFSSSIYFPYIEKSNHIKFNYGHLKQKPNGIAQLKQKPNVIGQWKQEPQCNWPIETNSSI